MFGSVEAMALSGSIGASAPIIMPLPGVDVLLALLQYHWPQLSVRCCCGPSKRFGRTLGESTCVGESNKAACRRVVNRPQSSCGGLPSADATWAITTPRPSLAPNSCYCEATSVTSPSWMDHWRPPWPWWLPVRGTCNRSHRKTGGPWRYLHRGPCLNSASYLCLGIDKWHLHCAF